jgi:hypothetical protein
MTIEPIDPAGLPDDRGNHTHGTLVTGATRPVLGEHRPALTVIVCDIYAEEWLLEIEAIAAA